MNSASASSAQAIAVVVVDSSHGGLLAEVLTRSGYVVHRVENPLAASGSIRDFLPSVILVKLRVYDRSAIDTCSALTGATPELPLIVVGPKIDGREKARMLDAGAADYVEYPFDTDELLARIRSLILTSQRGRLECILNVKWHLWADSSWGVSAHPDAGKGSRDSHPPRDQKIAKDVR